MEIFDKSNKALSSILDQYGQISMDDWNAQIDAYLDEKVSTIKALNKSIPGNLIQPYVAAMKFGSKDVMSKIVGMGFNPTFELLYKHHTVLMEYVSTNAIVDKEIISEHLRHVADTFANQPKSVSSVKVAEYLNRSEPFNKHDAVIMLSKRSSKNNYDGSEKELGDAIRLLGDHGAVKNKLDASNYNPLHWSIIEGNTRLSIQFIRSMTVDDCCVFNDGGETALSLAAKNGAHEVLIALLKKGVSIEGYQQRQGPLVALTALMSPKILANNPLLMALRGGHSKVSLDLVNLGATFFPANNQHDMHTALIYAAKMKDFDLMSVMLKRGANPNEVNSHGFSPILYLLLDYVQIQDPQAKKMIDMLLDKGASLEGQSKNGTSGIDLVIKMAQGGVGEAQDWLFKRNVIKLQEYVKSAVGLDLKNVKDLVINDENLADMRLNRVEQVNSVWLNRTAKSDEYKKSLSEKGFGEIKKLSGLISAVGGGSYTGLQFLSSQIDSHQYLADSKWLHLLTQNIEVATATITIAAAAFGVLKLTSDHEKRYAVSKWITENLGAVNRILIDPLMSRLRHSYDSKTLVLSHRLQGISEKVNLLLSRVSLALKAIKGEMDAPILKEVVETDNVIEMQAVRSKQPESQKIVPISNDHSIGR
jgi:ankyrin repeat protein